MSSIWLWVCRRSWMEEEDMVTICDHNTPALWHWCVTFILGETLSDNIPKQLAAVNQL